MKRILIFLSLFSSTSTLICCALPALFVALGAGASFAGLIGNFPQLIWFSEHKLWVFGLGGSLLLISGLLQWNSRQQTCPLNPEQAKACQQSRGFSKIIYFLSVVLYFVGVFFAFILPHWR